MKKGLVAAGIAGLAGIIATVIIKKKKKKITVKTEEKEEYKKPWYVD